MSIRLRELVQRVRSATTQQQEREVVAKEAAAIRTALSKEGAHDAYYRPRNVAKLLFLNMLGYATHWGQLECLKLIAAPDYGDKRIGYLALNVLLDESAEVLMLATQTLKTDVLHTNALVAGLALTTLGNVASEQICRDTAPELEQLLRQADPYVRKKAALCACRVARKAPELAEAYVPLLKGLLAERDHGVLVAATALAAEVARTQLAAVRQKLTKRLVALLRDVRSGGFDPEYDVGGTCDPFLQVALLRVLRMLGRGHAAASEQMNDVLVQALAGTDASRNAGLAVLYEAVATALAVEADADVQRTAIGLLGKFLANKDNNVRFVGLTTLGQVVVADTAAVQRHRAVVVECLKDADPSIRKRALYLIYALVDAANAKTLVRELLAFLPVADRELRPELTTRLCEVAERFAPSAHWYVDVLFQVMAVAGDCVPDTVPASYAAAVARSSELQPYAARRAYHALQDYQGQNVLAQVAAWCLGEYADLLAASGAEGETVDGADIVAVLDTVANHTNTSTATRLYIATATFKLTARLPAHEQERARAVLIKFTHSPAEELQQRASEYVQLLALPPATRMLLLARIPPADLRPSALTPAAALVEAAYPQSETAVPDLLGLSAPSNGTPSPTPHASSDLLGGLLQADVLPPAPSPAVHGQGDILALETGDVRVVLSFSKPNPQQPQYTLITATVTNVGAEPLSDLTLLAAPPRHAKYQLDQPSSTTVGPSEAATVLIKAANHAYGDKGLMMKLRVCYTVRGEPREMEQVCKNLPPGL